MSIFQKAWFSKKTPQVGYTNEQEYQEEYEDDKPDKEVQKMQFDKNRLQPKRSEKEDEDEEEEKQRRRMEAFTRQAKGEEPIQPEQRRLPRRNRQQDPSIEYSSGRMGDDGTLIIDSIRDKFRTRDYEHATQFQPPTMNDLTTDELDEILTFLETRRQAKTVFYSDPIVQFIRSVAGFVGTSHERVLGMNKGNKGVATLGSIYDGMGIQQRNISMPTATNVRGNVQPVRYPTVMVPGGAGASNFGIGASPIMIQSPNNMDAIPVGAATPKRLRVLRGSVLARNNPNNTPYFDRNGVQPKPPVFNLGESITPDDDLISNATPLQAAKSRKPSYEYSSATKNDKDEKDKEGEENEPRFVKMRAPGTSQVIELEEDLEAVKKDKEKKGILKKKMSAHEGDLDKQDTQPKKAKASEQKSGVSIQDLIKDPEMKDGVLDYLRRKRIANGLQWINRPEITGEVEISDSYYANIHLAYQYLIDRFGMRFYGASLEDFCTKSLKVWFAKLCANFINFGIAMSFTRVSLDKASGRLIDEKASFDPVFLNYYWDPNRKDFINKSLSNQGNYMISSSPAALYGNPLINQRLTRMGYYGQ